MNADCVRTFVRHVLGAPSHYCIICILIEFWSVHPTRKKVPQTSRYFMISERKTAYRWVNKVENFCAWLGRSQRWRTLQRHILQINFDYWILALQNANRTKFDFMSTKCITKEPISSNYFLLETNSGSIDSRISRTLFEFVCVLCIVVKRRCLRNAFACWLM